VSSIKITFERPPNGFCYNIDEEKPPKTQVRWAFLSHSKNGEPKKRESYKGTPS